MANTFKDLIKTTEGAVVLGGLTLTVLSPVFGPKTWAIGTGVAYVLLNLPNLVKKIKDLINKAKGE